MMTWLKRVSLQAVALLLQEALLVAVAAAVAMRESFR